MASNGYRIYGQAQVDLLQQILFYRALEVPLEEIRRMLSDSSFDRRRALEGHLHALEVRKKQVETQIATVRHTLAAMKGERTMTDQEKFAGLRDRFLEENQRRYGPELEARYGKETVDAAQDKAAAMTGAQWQAQEELSARIAQLLRTAMETGDPGGRGPGGLRAPPAVAGVVLAGGTLHQTGSPGDRRAVRSGPAVPGLLRGRCARVQRLFPGRHCPLL